MLQTLTGTYGQARTWHPGPAQRLQRRAIHTQAYGSPERNARIKIRQATLEDVGAVADLCAQVFGQAGLPPSSSPLLDRLLDRYGISIAEDVRDKLTLALTQKQQAALSARQYRLQQEAAILKARLAAARGERAVYPTHTPAEMRQVAKWQASRRFVCLVAVQQPAPGSSSSVSPPTSSASSAISSSSSSVEARAPEVLVGCVTVNMMQPEARLPPPFPSSSPFRAYISNMAVSPSCRRQGVARGLLAASKRIGTAWGEEGLWLHVSVDNQAARQLYRGAGFRAEGERFTLVPGSLREALMHKALPARGTSSRAAAGVKVGSVQPLSRGSSSLGAPRGRLEGGEAQARQQQQQSVYRTAGSSRVPQQQASSGVYQWRDEELEEEMEELLWLADGQRSTNQVQAGSIGGPVVSQEAAAAAAAPQQEVDRRAELERELLALRARDGALPAAGAAAAAAVAGGATAGGGAAAHEGAGHSGRESTSFEENVDGSSRDTRSSSTSSSMPGAISSGTPQRSSSFALSEESDISAAAAAGLPGLSSSSSSQASSYASTYTSSTYTSSSGHLWANSSHTEVGSGGGSSSGSSYGSSPSVAGGDASYDDGDASYDDGGDAPVDDDGGGDDD